MVVKEKEWAGGKDQEGVKGFYSRDRKKQSQTAGPLGGIRDKGMVRDVTSLPILDSILCVFDLIVRPIGDKMKT